jgi:hypothetical protein
MPALVTRMRAPACAALACGALAKPTAPLTPTVPPLPAPPPKGAVLLAGWAAGRYLGLDEVTSATYLVSRWVGG